MVLAIKCCSDVALLKALATIWDVVGIDAYKYRSNSPSLVP